MLYKKGLFALAQSRVICARVAALLTRTSVPSDLHPAIFPPNLCSLGTPDRSFVSAQQLPERQVQVVEYNCVLALVLGRHKIAFRFT